MADADVALRLLGEKPAVLEHLMEYLGRGQPALEPLGHGRDGRLEDLLPPFRGDRRLRERAPGLALACLSVARDVVEHATRLVLLRVEACEPQQLVPVVAGLDDVRVERDPVAAVGRLEGDLLDVEAELVQAVEALVELVAFVGTERLVARELVPQPVVPTDDLFARLVRVEVLGEPDFCVDVEQLADDVLLCDVEVVVALALRERAVQLACLGVDEVCRERAGVAPEERVRERAVAPEEPAQVQAREQLDERVQEVRAQVGDAGAREQSAVGQGVVEVPGDQDRVEIVAPRGHDPDGLDDGERLSLQAAEERPLAPGGALRQLLDRVQRAVVLDEANDMAADPAHHGDEPVRLPVFERRLPGQVEKARMARAGDQLKRRAQAASLGRTAGLRRCRSST